MSSLYMSSLYPAAANNNGVDGNNAAGHNNTAGRNNGAGGNNGASKDLYFKLDPAVAQEIERQGARGTYKSPFRCKDEAVVRRNGFFNDRATLTRTAFGRDIEKIINVPAYNRYADKTQVFSFVQNDDICRRGLHVQLVSRIARNIGEILGLNNDLVEAIALGHDVGHTPFGHAGERFLGKLYHAHTGRYFNHNVHSVRVLDRLYRRNVSLQTLNGVLCHNGEFAQQVLRVAPMEGFEDLDKTVERCMSDEAVIKQLRPSTLEACVVRICDMVAYLGKDRQDALEMGVLENLAPFESKTIGTKNTTIIHNLTVDIINNSYGKDRIALSEEVFADLKRAKEQNYELIYLQEGVNLSSGDNLIEEMFADLYERLLEDCVRGRRESPLFRHHVRNLIERSLSIEEKTYLKEDPNQIVVDYMASMTDSYFTALYAHLFPQSGKHIIQQEYCYDLR